MSNSWGWSLWEIEFYFPIIVVGKEKLTLKTSLHGCAIYYSNFGGFQHSVWDIKLAFHVDELEVTLKVYGGKSFASGNIFLKTDIE